MATMLIASKTRALAEFGNQSGRVEASIRALPKGRFTYTIRTNLVSGVNADTLADFALAIRMVCRHIGKIVDKPVRFGGKKIDPDEPTQTEGEDWTVIYRVFPADKTALVRFTRYHVTGQVKARVQPFSFTDDLPSAVQLAFVANQASELMKKYAVIV